MHLNQMESCKYREGVGRKGYDYFDAADELLNGIINLPEQVMSAIDADMSDCGTEFDCLGKATSDFALRFSATDELVTDVLNLPAGDLSEGDVSGGPAHETLADQLLHSIDDSPADVAKAEGRVAFRKPRAFFSVEEDNQLRELVAAQQAGRGYTGPRWKQIAHHMPGRDSTQCRQRWRKIQPGQRKGKWSREEDAALGAAAKRILRPPTVLAAGGGRAACCTNYDYRREWAAVAAAVPGRSSSQCRYRWTNHLRGRVHSRLLTAAHTSSSQKLFQKERLSLCTQPASSSSSEGSLSAATSAGSASSTSCSYSTYRKRIRELEEELASLKHRKVSDANENDSDATEPFCPN